MKKRVLSFLIVICMLASMLSAVTYAKNDPRQLVVHYDQGRAGVFVTLDGGTPTADAAHFLADNAMCSPGAAGDAGKTVTMLIDTTLSLDFEAYDNGGQIRFFDRVPDDNTAIYIKGFFERENGERFDKLLVDGGNAVDNTVRYENGILTLSSAGFRNIELSVSLSREEYVYNDFGSTPEAPVVIEISFWGGSITLPAGIADENIVQNGERIKLRTSLETESLNIGWYDDEIVRRIRVEGAGEHGDWLEIENPEGTSYTLALDQTWDNGDPRDFYRVELEFDQVREDDYTMRLHYDMNFGIAYVSALDNDQLTPDNSPVQFANTPVSVRIDNSKRIDWDAWDRGETVISDTQPIDGLSISIIAHIDDQNGERFDGAIVENGVVVKDGFTFQDGVLTFTPASRHAIDLDFFWTQDDFAFAQFGGTDEAPIVIEASFYGANEFEAQNVDEQDIIRANGRMKVRVSKNTASVMFAWSANDIVRRIRVEGMGENGDWLEIDNPEGTSYMLGLGHTWDNGEPRDFYRIEFEFDGARDDDNELRLYYDMDGGIVFNADEAIFDGSVIAFGEGEISLKLDHTKRMDWNTWDTENPKITDNESWDNLSINVFARFDLPSGERFEGTIVRDGQATFDGVTFQDGVLTFTPLSRHAINLEIYWTNEDYEFSQFRGTEDKPVIVELRAWGNGEFEIPDYIADEDIMTLGERTVFRVSPDEHPSILLTWHGSTVERFRTELENDWYEVENPDFDSYELVFDQKWDNGEPKDRYQVEINFRGEKVYPGVFVNNYDIDYTVSGLIDEGERNYSFADGVDSATVTIDVSNERYHAVWMRILRFGQDPEVNVYAPENGVIVLANDGSFYDIEIVDWDIAMPGEFYVNSYGMNVRIGGQPIDVETKQMFTPGMPITFSADEIPYRIAVVPIYGDDDITEFATNSKTFTYTPVSDDGFEINIFRTKEQYEFFAFQNYNDYSRYEVVPVELEYKAGGADNGWIQTASDVVDSIQGFDVFLIKVERGTQSVSVKPVAMYGYKFNMFIGEDDITDSADENGVYVFDLTQGLDRDKLMRAVLVKDDTVPNAKAYIFGKDAEYAKDDTIIIGKDAEFLIGFNPHGNVTGLYLKADTSALTDAGFTASEEMIGDLLFIKLKGTAPAEKQAILTYAWCEPQNDTPVYSYSVNVKIAPLPVEFADVVKGAYYEEPVQWAVTNGVTNGTGANTFSPNNKCTRGQVVTFLWRAAGAPEPTSSANPFTDVKESDYFYKAVLWAVENGVTSGTSKTTFSPASQCTRGQVVTFLWRAKGQTEPASSLNPFTDVSESAYYFKAMLWAVEKNITNGTSATTFSPNNTCTRGQVVTFLYRAFK